MAKTSNQVIPRTALTIFFMGFILSCLELFRDVVKECGVFII